MPTVFISKEKIINVKRWDNTEQLSLSILKDVGVPITGTVILQLDPKYTFKIRRDAETLGVFVDWQ